MIDDALRERARASVSHLTSKPPTVDAKTIEQARAATRYRVNPPLDRAVSLAAALCKHFEGAYLRPYICPAGVWTIAFGATFYQTGVRVSPHDPPITLGQAEDLLDWMLRKVFMPEVMRLCPGIEQPEQLAAITDFAFNLGTGRLAASTLRRKVNAGDWAAVPGELRKWTRGGGKVLRGLAARREAEVALINSIY